MRTVEIISNLPTVFIRTLEGGQELCPECGGIQLVSDGKFIRSCKTCFPGKHGVVDRCQYCGELAVYNHNCDGKKEAERRERAHREKEKWDKIEKITIKESVSRFEMVYIDHYENFVFPEDLIEWVENEEYDDEDFNRETLYVYGTSKTQIRFDAGSIIENACDDLHEDAYDHISRKAIEELQTLLDQWAEKYGTGTITYNADMKVGIIIPEKNKTG
jgi:hypothetical protein